MADKLDSTLWFPSTSEIKHPHAGSKKLTVKADVDTSSSLQLKPLSKKLTDEYVKVASCGLTFGDDVLRERCYHLLPYDQKYLYEALDPSGLPRVSRRIPKRGSQSVVLVRPHQPCHLPIDKAMKRLRPLRKRSESVFDASKVTSENETSRCNSALDDVFLGSPRAAARKPSGEWDVHLMSRLSENTARWLAGTRTETGPPKNKLNEFLDVRYGRSGMDDRQLELVGEDDAVDIEQETVQKRTKQWKKSDEV